VQVHLCDEEDEDEWDEDAAAVQLPLAGLAEHDQDEDCVDEVIGDRHGAMIFFGTDSVVGPRFEPWVDLRLNPWVDRHTPPVEDGDQSTVAPVDPPLP
jgi:hypothetical protein